MTYRLELTNECNMNCSFCVNSIRDKAYLSYDKLKTFVKSQDLSKESVHIFGGEPLLHPQIYDIINLAINNFEKVSLFTNGSLLINNIPLRSLIRSKVNQKEIYLVLNGYTFTKELYNALCKSEYDEYYLSLVINEETLDNLYKLPINLCGNAIPILSPDILKNHEDENYIAFLENNIDEITNILQKKGYKLNSILKDHFLPVKYKTEKLQKYFNFSDNMNCSYGYIDSSFSLKGCLKHQKTIKEDANLYSNKELKLFLNQQKYDESIQGCLQCTKEN